MTVPSARPAAPPPPDTLLLLVRHAEQRTMRVDDSELSARGERQAERLAIRLSRLPVSAVVASTLRRSQQTAAAVGRACGLAVEVQPDLDEVRISTEARQTRYTESAASALEPHPDEYVRTTLAAVRMVGRVQWGGPGVEAMASLRSRGVAAVESVVARHPGGVVVVVSHGGIINAVLGAWTGATRDMWFVPWHTGVSAVLTAGSERILLSLNDASHLEEGEEILALVSGSLV